MACMVFEGVLAKALVKSFGLVKRYLPILPRGCIRP